MTLTTNAGWDAGDLADQIVTDAVLYDPKIAALYRSGKKLDQMDILAMRLGYGQVPMRRKQGVFKPRRITVATLGAWRISPPPALVVQFDSHGVKTTFPMVL